MSLLDEVTQWLSENVAQPLTAGKRKLTNLMDEFDPEATRQALALMPQEQAQAEINAMPEDIRVKVLGDSNDIAGQAMAAGTVSPLDFVNKGMGPRGTAVSEAAANAAADTVLPGKKARLAGKLGKLAWEGAKAAGLIGTGAMAAGKLNGNGQTSQSPATNGGQLEYTPEQAEEAGQKKIIDEAIRTKDQSAPKEEAFDINAIADKYGAEVSPSGGLISDKEIKNAGKEGLVQKGYIEKGGKKIFIYGAKETDKGTSEDSKNGQPKTREGFYKVAAAQIKKNLGIDPDTFNPVAEARKVLNNDGEYQYMRKRLSEGNFTPQKRAYIQGLMKDREDQVTKELTYKAALAKDGLKRMMEMFDKQKDKFGVAAAGSTIYDKETGKPVSTVKGKATQLPASTMTSLEKTVDRAFLNEVPEASRQMGGKVYDNLSEAARVRYDQVIESAGRLLQDSLNTDTPLTPQEAVRQAAQNMKGTGQKASPGTKLDKTTATAILSEAQGDKNKARQIAKERGYSLQ